MSAEDVRSFYTEYGEKEWFRLIKDPYRQLEFKTSMHFIKKHLPRKGILLDAGGGPGRYTIALAKMGHDIILLDLTPKLRARAQDNMMNKNKPNKIQPQRHTHMIRNTAPLHTERDSHGHQIPDADHDPI